MSQNKLRKAIGAVKDRTSISLAKVGSSTSLADLNVAIVKATRHDEYPAEEKYIREILSLTCYSKTFISACVNTLARRLSKTKSWTVALKTLILIQRLIADGDPAYEEEIFFSTRRGTRLLNMSDFRDSRSNSWDFSAFVRTYALYLDERLEYRMQNRRGRRSMFGCDEDVEEAYAREREREREKEKEKEKEIVVRTTPVRDMKTEQLFSKMQHFHLLLERFLACRPTGGAKSHRICIVALYSIVKESFQIYYDITEVMDILIDRFTDMDVPDCVKVYDIFCRVGKQYDELDLFYSWCKSTGIARSSEYPEIEKITPKKLEVMDEFIKDKSGLAQSKKAEDKENTQEAEEVKEPEPEPEPEQEPKKDMNDIKALPAPEESTDEVQEVKEEEPKEEKVIQTEGDLLNLGDDAVTSEEHGNKLALALFDGAAPATATQALPWHAFDETADWETALVQSASNLNNQKPELGGGFDTLLLDGMYKHAETNAAMQGPGYGVSGSASSVALGSAGRPAMLALPAPPTSGSGASSVSSDPFAASLAVAPPAYVQISEMEKKQRLLVEEQMMWQQFQKDGRQGHLASRGLQPQPYVGEYQQNYGNYYR